VTEQPVRRPFLGLEFQAKPRDAWFLLLAGAIIGLDQGTKALIRAFVDRGESHEVFGELLRVVHFTNTGAAFGMFQGAGPLLAITSIAGMLAILVYLFNPGFAHPLVRTGLAFMLGGAVGNLIDRLAEGRVVDFIKLPNWPAFNVADSAITVGVIMLVVSLLWMQDEEKPSEA
jgi:signal peptidase II